ncbi:hypothetical protein JL09_g7044, partial [Pichia kudriavzevii]
GRPSKRL